MSDCIFCKIIKGEIPVKKLADNEVAIAFQDIQPQAPIHNLILPKKHVASLNDMTDEDRATILPELYKIADNLAKSQGFKERGYRTVINNQSEGGQTVFHLHMHVMSGAQMKPHFGA